MKRKAILIMIILATVLLFSGCGKITFDMTSSNDWVTVKINKAKDGDTAETPNFEVGKNRVTVIESSLASGSVKIEFVSVDVFYNEKGPDDVIPIETVETVTVGVNEKKEITLPQNEYIMQLTTIGETEGTIKVTVEKP